MPDESPQTNTSPETAGGPLSPWAPTSPTAPPSRWQAHWDGATTLLSMGSGLYFIGPAFVKSIARISEGCQCPVWSTYIPVVVLGLLLGVTVYHSALDRLKGVATAVLPLLPWTRKP